MLILPKVVYIISIIPVRKSNDVLHKTQRVETQFYLESQIPQGKENKTEVLDYLTLEHVMKL